MKVLVTGANGHIGSNLVRACLEAGMTPVAFVRPKSDRRGLAGLDVEIREGDLLDAPSVARASEGIELVFHVGAAHRNWAPDENEIIAPAVIGTSNVVDAARRAGVRRVVYTSTGATLGFADAVEKPLDEAAPYPPMRNVYARAKIEAEKVALAAAGDGLDLVVVNPSGVFGPLDYRLTPATRGIVGMLQGDPSFLGIPLTDVRDVAAGHLLAAAKGERGKRYLLTGDVLTPLQIADAYKELTGIRPSVFQPPRFLMRFIAGSAERKARKSHEDAAVTRDQVEDVFGRHLSYDSRRARTELGATFRPAREVLRDAVRWLLFTNALKPRVAAKVRATLAAGAAPDPGWLT